MNPWCFRAWWDLGNEPSDEFPPPIGDRRCGVTQEISWRAAVDSACQLLESCAAERRAAKDNKAAAIYEAAVKLIREKVGGG